MKIFETHAHYDDERFDEDRDELISSMLSDAGELDYIVNVGASRQGCEASLALAAQYEKDVVIPKEQKRMRAKIEQEFLTAKPKRRERLLSLFPYLKAL